MWALAGLARCVPQLAARSTATAVATADNAEKKHAIAVSSDREKNRRCKLLALERADRELARNCCFHDEPKPSAASVRPGDSRGKQDAAASSHRRPIGRVLEQALTGGGWYSGRFMRDVYDRLGGSPVPVLARQRQLAIVEHLRRHAADSRLLAECRQWQQLDCTLSVREGTEGPRLCRGYTRGIN